MESEKFGVIFTSELIEAVESLEVLKEYPDDTPFPSALLFGTTHLQRPLHFVAAYSESEKLLTIVTVYQPDPDLWIEYKKRKDK